MTPELMHLLQHWEFEPVPTLGLIGLAVAYLVATKFKFTWRTYMFLSGIVVIYLGLLSPLDELADKYLFSAHMLQHMILEFIGPVMLVIALPRDLVQQGMKVPVLKLAERVLGNPYVALIVATLVMLVWHVPPIYDITLKNEPVHIAEHMTYLVSGVMLWWPVFKPIPEGRLKPLEATVYLTVAAFLASILGMIYTMADVAFYSFYTTPQDPYHLLPLIRNEWGLNPVEDQKLGGAIMWVICTLNFFFALMAVMIEWLQEREGNHNVRTTA